MNRITLGLYLAFSTLLTGIPPAWSQTQPFPNKPIRIVTTEPGSGGDLISRFIVPSLTNDLTQPVIVDNRGLISSEVVAKSAPDGSTLLVYGNSLWLAPFLRDNLAYDPIRDFSPITMAVSSPTILTVNASSPTRSVSELIAQAKERPGQLNYAASGAGATNHLSAELFKSMAGVDIVRVFYKGPSSAMNDLLAGRVDLMFLAAATGLPQIKTGKLRALAITTAKRSAIAPSLATIAESLPGYESILTIAFLTPSGTPPSAIKTLNLNIVRSLNRPDVKDKILGIGAEVIGSSAEECAVAIKAEMTKWGKLIKEANIRSE